MCLLLNQCFSFVYSLLVPYPKLLQVKNAVNIVEIAQITSGCFFLNIMIKDKSCFLNENMAPKK